MPTQRSGLPGEDVTRQPSARSKCSDIGGCRDKHAFVYSRARSVLRHPLNGAQHGPLQPGSHAALSVRILVQPAAVRVAGLPALDRDEPVARGAPGRGATNTFGLHPCGTHLVLLRPALATTFVGHSTPPRLRGVDAPLPYVVPMGTRWKKWSSERRISGRRDFSEAGTCRPATGCPEV